MEVENLGRLISKLEAAKKGGVKGAELAARLSADDLQSRSVPVTPKREGTLRASANVQPETGVFRTKDGFYVTFGYDTEYAYAVHELPNEETEWTTPGTGSKYLEGPFAENKPRYAKAIMEATKKGVRGG